MKNVELGRKVLSYIEANPEEFDMKTWGYKDDHDPACGTVACLAGHVLLLSGYTLEGAAFTRPLPSYYTYVEPGAEAAEILGLSAEEHALRLFDVFRPNDEAIALFREVVEKSEAEAGRGDL